MIGTNEVTEATERLELLYQFGAMDRQAYTGTQFDLMQTAQHKNGQVTDSSLCDHTCSTEVLMPDREAREQGIAGAMKLVKTGGCYHCDSSAAHNSGLDPRGLAPVEQLVTWLDKEVAAQRRFHEIFMREVFPAYCKDYQVSAEAEEALRTAFTNATIEELNGFGGDPEMHGQIFEFATEAKNRKLRFNLTTTGRKFIESETFCENFRQNPSNVLALSFDDITPAELVALHSDSDEVLEAKWRKLMREEPNHGQALKALEGVFAGRWVTRNMVTGNPKPQVLVMFNTVIHSGNLGHFKELVATVANLMPKARVNPYPAQSSFEDKQHGPCWKPADMPALEELIDWLIAETVTGNPNITVRLPYYLFLKAQFNCFRNDPEELCRRMSGYEGWKCFRRPGAYRYAQISGSVTPWGATLVTIEQLPQGKTRSRKAVQRYGNKEQAGGQPGCYWQKDTVTAPLQIHEMSVEELAHYKLYGVIAQAAASTNQCQGCIMPRLMFNIVTIELGMDPMVIPHYIVLRKQYFGY